MFSFAQIVKAALISLTLTLIALAGAKANLFGFEDAMDLASDDAYQSIMAGRYGHDRAGQNQVRVIYIDEPGVEVLRQHGWRGWPPGYAALADMIADMKYAAGQPPRAVFADLVITGEGIASPEDQAEFDYLVTTLGDMTGASVWSDNLACAADPLVRIGCIVEAGGVPVILAKASPVDRPSFTASQRTLDQVAIFSPILVGSRAYPLFQDYGPRNIDGVRRFDLSPAEALYAANCLHEILRNGQEDACGGDPGIHDAAKAARAAIDGAEPEPANLEVLGRSWGTPMSVLWGDREADRQAEITQRVSSGEIPTCQGRMPLVERTLRRMINRPVREVACAYAFHIGYDRLVAGYGLEQADYDFILADRLILLGSHLRNSDWAPTPVHGQLPGVHYHAMALDNLLEFGPDYRRTDAEGAWLSTDDILVSILTFVLLLTVILAVMARNSLLEDIRPEWKSKPPFWVLVAYYCGLVLLVVGITFLIAILGAQWWNRAVINWMGVVALAFSVLAMAGRLTLITDIGGPLSFVDRWSQSLEFGERSLSRRPPVEAPPPSPKLTPTGKNAVPGPKSTRTAKTSKTSSAPRSRRKPDDASS